MEAAAVVAGLAQRRVKRAMGQLRKAAADLADTELDVLGEVELPAGADLDKVNELLAFCRRGRRSVTVVVVARPGRPPADPSGLNRE